MLNSFMGRWKSWYFGPFARRLPVVKGLEEWAAAHKGRRIEEDTVARRSPSGAVPETLRALIDRPSNFLVRRRREWDVVKYSRLYTGESYPVRSSYDCSVRNAWLHVPSGFVITQDREVLAFSSYFLPSLYEGHSSCPLEQAPWIDETVFKICTTWGNNYAHWLMDALPKADVLAAGDGCTVVADMPSPPFQKQSLGLLGLRNLLVPSNELIRFRELRFVSCDRSGVPDLRPLLRVRDRLRAAAGTPTGPRRIYLSRQRTRRRIVNGDEVGRILADHGFEEIFAEELDFATQVRAFSGAEVIFGAHGAGTMNVLFTPPGAALIEAFNPRVWDHAAHRVASLCGVRHYHFFAQNASSEHDIFVDPRLLQRVLALALDELPRSLSVEEVF